MELLALGQVSREILLDPVTHMVREQDVARLGLLGLVLLSLPLQLADELFHAAGHLAHLLGVLLGRKVRVGVLAPELDHGLVVRLRRHLLVLVTTEIMLLALGPHLGHPLAPVFAEGHPAILAGPVLTSAAAPLLGQGLPPHGGDRRNPLRGLPLPPPRLLLWLLRLFLLRGGGRHLIRSHRCRCWGSAIFEIVQRLIRQRPGPPGLPVDVQGILRPPLRAPRPRSAPPRHKILCDKPHAQVLQFWHGGGQ
mmetsp:Transcript_2393/g.7358  ORF Transcript_2393/g.7358 Transcript_2393/m.7358 type:complete len:251 (-) Transcript_2393:351-1103(-)